MASFSFLQLGVKTGIESTGHAKHSLTTTRKEYWQKNKQIQRRARRTDFGLKMKRDDSRPVSDLMTRGFVLSFPSSFLQTGFLTPFGWIDDDGVHSVGRVRCNCHWSWISKSNTRSSTRVSVWQVAPAIISLNRRVLERRIEREQKKNEKMFSKTTDLCQLFFNFEIKKKCQKSMTMSYE